MFKQKKPLGLDKYGVQKTMRASDYIGDGIGQLSLSIINVMIGQLTYFYTEKVGVAAAVVATALLIPKIIDAFSDLVMGKIMDNTNSPKGKCRPWFLRMAIPAAVNMVLLFTIPKGMSSMMQAVYIVITNTLISAVIYTAVAVPYSSLMAIRTQSSEERGTMGIVRTIFNMAGGMAISIGIIPLTNALGGDQKAWIIFGSIMAAVVGTSLFIAYHTARENNADAEGEQQPAEEDNEKDISFTQGLGILLKNKFWVIMVVTSVINGINYGLMNGSIVWYARYMLGNDNLAATISAVAMLPTFIGFVIVPLIAKKLGMRDTCIVAFIIGCLGCVVRIILPYSLMATLIGTVMFGFAMMPFMSYQGGMLNNCVEYNEWKTGYRLVGLTNSVNSFAGKISSAVGGSIIGWVLAGFGYMTGVAAEMQPASVQTGVMVFSVFIPLAINIIMIVLLRMYTLEKDYGRIVAELNERKAQKH